MQSITKSMNARKITKGTGSSFSMMGITLTEVVVSGEFGGALTILEQVVLPGSGSPLHTLPCDKAFYVQSGAFEFMLDDEKVTGSAGDWLIIPRGTVHNFHNSGLTPGTLLVFTTPGGHENFLRDFSEIAREGRPPYEKMAQVASQHGVEIISPKP